MKNFKHDQTRSAKIEAIRAAAFVQLKCERPNTCPTCIRVKDQPFFRADQHGKGVAGCVDAFHHDAVLIGERARWHYRAEAQDMRAADLKWLVSL